MPRIGLTRTRLIEAGAEMADAEGFSALTLAALARRFEVKLASLYAHVASSHDLKVGVALHALERLAERAEAAITGRAGREAMFGLANAHRQFARDHPGLYEAARFPLDTQTAQASAGVRLARLNLDVMHGYALSEDDQVHAVRLLASIILGFPMLELSGSFSHRQPDPEVSWHQSLDAVHTTLTGWAANHHEQPTH